MDIGRKDFDFVVLRVGFIAELGGEGEGYVCLVMDVVAECDLEGAFDELACIGLSGIKRGFALYDSQLLVI